MSKGSHDRFKLISGFRIPIIFFLVLTLSPIFAANSFAQAPEKARMLAEKFITDKGNNLKSNQDIIFDNTTEYKDIWIFERHEPRAFVLVKKEEDFSIAGYSFENTFLVDGEIPDPGKLCLDAVQNISFTEMAEHKRLKSYPQYIKPLLESKWNQDCFFVFTFKLLQIISTYNF